MSRAPGVGVVIKKDVVLELVAAGAAAEVACAAETDEADDASVALVRLKPSGYWTTLLPTSPGSWKGGCTGFSVLFLLPQLPTQKDETSDMSIQIPSKDTFLYHISISVFHHSKAPVPFMEAPIQSGKSV